MTSLFCAIFFKFQWDNGTAPKGTHLISIVMFNFYRKWKQDLMYSYILRQSLEFDNRAGILSWNMRRCEALLQMPLHIYCSSTEEYSIIKMEHTKCLKKSSLRITSCLYVEYIIILYILCAIIFKLYNITFIPPSLAKKKKSYVKQ